jgi:hypothetical protein
MNSTPRLTSVAARSAESRLSWSVPRFRGLPAIPGEAVADGERAGCGGHHRGHAGKSGDGGGEKSFH